MGVDISKMRRGFQREQRGGEYLSLQPGETLLYIHPPCREDDKFEPTDGVNYVPVVVHYGIGKGMGGGGKGGSDNGRMVASLDPEINPILEHPFIKRYLKARKIKITGECPVSKLLQSGDLDDKELDNMRASTRYVWGVTPIAHRSSSSDSWNNMMPKPSVLMVGKQTFDGIMEVFFDNGDITDAKEAVLVIVKREGTKMSTKYTVRADPESLKRPKKLAPEVRAAISKATKEDGDCDLFKVVSNMVKSPAEVQAIISGVKMEDVDDDFDEDEDEKPKSGKTKGKSAKPADDDDDDDGESELYESKSKSKDDDEDEDEDEKPKAKAKGAKETKPASAAKSKSKPVVEDSEDEDEESDDEESDDDDEESEPEPAPKAKAKSKPEPAPKAKAKAKPEPEADEDEDSDDDDDDESDSDADDADDVEDDIDDDSESDDSDEDDDDDSAAVAAAAKAKAEKAKGKAAKAEAKPAKSDKASKAAESTDDDLGLSEIDAELERIATPKEKSKSKKANGATAHA